jgi:hypothetical protein
MMIQENESISIIHGQDRVQGRVYSVNLKGCGSFLIDLGDRNFCAVGGVYGYLKDGTLFREENTGGLVLDLGDA